MAVTRKDMNVTPGTETVTTTPTPHAAETEREELLRLRREVEQLRAQTATPQDVTWERPSFGLSEGERQDLLLHGKTNSPFTGEEITAEGEGVERAQDKGKAPKAAAVTFDDGTTKAEK